MHSSVRPNKAHWKWRWQHPAALPVHLSEADEDLRLFFFFCYRSRLGLQFCRCHKWFVGFVWILFILGNIQMWFVSGFWRAREELFRKWWDLIMRTKSLKTRRPHPSHRTFMVLVSSFSSKRLSLCQPSAIWNTCCFPLAVMNVSCLWLNLFYLAESMLLAGAVFVAFPRGS